MSPNNESPLNVSLLRKVSLSLFSLSSCLQKRLGSAIRLHRAGVCSECFLEIGCDFSVGSDALAVAMLVVMKNGQTRFRLRKFLAISLAIQTCASDCDYNAMVHPVSSCISILLGGGGTWVRPPPSGPPRKPLLRVSVFGSCLRRLCAVLATIQGSLQGPICKQYDVCCLCWACLC